MKEFPSKTTKAQTEYTFLEPTPGGMKVGVKLDFLNDAVVAVPIQPKGLHLYGIGSTREEALDDLLTTMRESYDLLEAREASLGVALQQELRLLRYILRREPQLSHFADSTGYASPLLARRGNNSLPTL
jgi:hypothetical protein